MAIFPPVFKRPDKPPPPLPALGFLNIATIPQLALAILCRLSLRKLSLGTQQRVLVLAVTSYIGVVIGLGNVPAESTAIPSSTSSVVAT